MEEARKSGRKPGKKYTHRVITYLAVEDVPLLEGLMSRRDEDASALLRKLLREEAARVGLVPAQD
jgi:hypothetical protein